MVFPEFHKLLAPALLACASLAGCQTTSGNVTAMALQTPTDGSISSMGATAVFERACLLQENQTERAEAARKLGFTGSDSVLRSSDGIMTITLDQSPSENPVTRCSLEFKTVDRSIQLFGGIGRSAYLKAFSKRRDAASYSVVNGANGNFVMASAPARARGADWASLLLVIN
ncbi:hypothetical protein ACS3SW_15815 [Roseobacteraceae bacterium S113]